MLPDCVKTAEFQQLLKAKVKQLQIEEQARHPKSINREKLVLIKLFS
jgi:hypothetical protein